ncbi:histidine phosphatase superfamily [Mycena sp. CBHHK59/15]|nr:histidine phosphatase superfamily [Mycena sp. CBHHK59/15]
MMPARLCGLAVLALSFSVVNAAKFPHSEDPPAPFSFLPPTYLVTTTDTYFPNANQVGFAGPTPTGNEANAIAMVPSVATVNRGDIDVVHHFGNLAPWQSVKSLGLPHASASVPKGCKINQVHLVHRHGARYPMTGALPSAFALVLHGLASTMGVTGLLAFSVTWEYKMGAELLTPFGRSQLFDLGIGFRVRYSVERVQQFNDLPVFRTTSEAGFFGMQSCQQDYHQLIEVESLGFNSTLASYEQCPNANNAIANFGQVQALKWVSVYLVKAQKQLQPFITGLLLSSSILVAIQQLCAYETVSLGYSPFCDLFTEEEWLGYSYLNDLLFWYGYGPGNPATSAQGIGYVQELLSRLTQTHITEFATTVNKTIVSSKVTFPLDQPMYVDATHDVVISAIITALNFTSLAANGPLPTDHIPPNHSYIINYIAPFASNLGSETNSDGLCPLLSFIDGMKQRIEEVDFSDSRP